VANAVAAAADPVMIELAIYVFTVPVVPIVSRFKGSPLTKRARVWMLDEHPSGIMTITFLVAHAWDTISVRTTSIPSDIFSIRFI
jgi:hypothetical protein